MTPVAPDPDPPPPPSAPAVYTYGWDTVFVIPATDVNRAIVDHKSSPPRFAADEPDFTVSGDFGDWQITMGGDGKNVRLALPLSAVHVAYKSTGKRYDFTSGRAIIEVALHYIPHTESSGSDGDPYALVVKDTASSPSDPAVTMVQMTLDPTPGTVTLAIAQQALDDWCNANLAQFQHVFAVVDLNRRVDTGQWAFVTPNYTSYGYLDGADLASSLFGVLTMTGDRTGEQLSEQLSVSAIPTASKAGFLVSQERTLLDLVRPAIIQTYKGLNDQNFLVSDDHTELYLADGVSVDLAPVESHGSTYYPTLKQLTVKSTGNILTLTCFTETPVGLGLTAVTQSTHWYTVDLGAAKSGQTLVFAEAQPPSIVHDVRQSPGSQLTQLIIEIAAAVALVLLTVLTDGAALIVGGLVIGLLLGADQIVPALIEKVNTDDSPSIDLLQVNAVDPIQWTGSASFKLDSASLNVSLQLGGDPLFA